MSVSGNSIPEEGRHALRHARPYPSGQFLSDTLGVLYSVRRWIVALMILIAGQSALAPSVAWITKEVLASVDGIDQDTVIRLLLQWAPIYLLIVGGETILKFVGKVFEKLIDVRLLIVLQRLYLDRRADETEGKDASQVLFGSRVANKGFDIIYKKTWRILTTIVSVLLWQLALGAEWILLMVLSVIPAGIFVWKLGPALQRLSLEILHQHELIASNTGQARRTFFEDAQDSWMRSSIRFEIIKWFIDEGAQVLLWASLVALVLLSYVLDLGIVPTHIDLPAAGAFLVNLRLIANPLMEISKTYSKWREAYPAMVAVFTGGSGR